MQRRGYGVRYDDPGKRSHSSVPMAVDAQTHVTEWLRERIHDLEDKLASATGGPGGGADTAGLQRRIADLEAEARSAVSTGAALTKARAEARELRDEKEVYKEMAEAQGHDVVGVADAAELQAKVRMLEAKLNTATRERQLGLGGSTGGAPSGYISEEKYNDVVAQNNKWGPPPPARRRPPARPAALLPPGTPHGARGGAPLSR